MAPVYTKQLYAAASLSAGVHVLGGPPDGYIWVVRDVEWVAPQPAGPLTLTGVALAVGGIIGFARIHTPWAYWGETYQWQGRQVVPAGNELQAYVAESGWSLLISGYELSLP